MKIRKILSRLFWELYKKTYPITDDFLYADNRRRFHEKMMDPAFPYKKYKGINPYFAKWGFKFPIYECEYYAQQNGVKSDLYLPIAFYNKYIFPYLDQDAWHWGYADKNMFARLLNIEDAQKYVDVLIPECIVCCDNGQYYIQGNNHCSRNEAIDYVCKFADDFIIKPTVESSHGHGVAKINAEEINYNKIASLFTDYGENFTIQKLIIQHKDLAAFNPTSVNTIRITTYLKKNGEVKILYAAQRFGGKGKVYDNADDPNGSGGFCAILDDGSIKREVHHYRNMQVGRLEDNIPAKIPYYDKVKDCVKFMHTRFPHFALIGWDVTVTPEGHPLIIEYNFRPGLGTGQLANGPLFNKEDLDEIMKDVSKARNVPFKKIRVKFPNRPPYWS